MISKRSGMIVAIAVLLAGASLLARILTTGIVDRTGSGDAFPALAPSAQSLEVEDTLPSALQGLEMEAVQEWSGPGGQPFYVAVRSNGVAGYLSRRIGRQTFELGLRSTGPQLAQYPCSSCHEGRRVTGPRDPEAVHRDIRPVHPRESATDCSTCHVTGDVSALQLAGGARAEIDHAYRLCARCHFAQTGDWAMGAHGKRLVGWRGRRVVMGCADCHDPHRPATEKRLPVAGVTLPDGLGGESHD